MFDFDQPLTPILQDEPPRRRGRPWLAWAVIAAVASGVAWAQAHPAPRRRAGGTNVLMQRAGEWQARYLVGAAHIFDQQQRQPLVRQAATLDQGSLAQRLKYV
ncbi:MAG: hypothetical protein ACYC6M_15620, partial [Terriglobales bacterium]